MSLAADILQGAIVPNYFALTAAETKSASEHLSAIITAKRKGGYYLDYDLSTNQIGIDFQDSSYVCSAIGRDALRFANASFSSIQEIGREIEDRTSFSWSLIKLYYGAFYAAHCILRIIGESCSYLNSAHVKKLKELAFAQNVIGFHAKSGQYHWKLAYKQRGFDILLLSGNGGSHEKFWCTFHEFVENAINQALKSSFTASDINAFYSQFESFKQVLSLGGNQGSWLSSIRNEVQYQHAYGAWRPVSIQRNERLNLARSATQWHADPMSIHIDKNNKSKLSIFVSACAFIISLCKELLTRINIRSSAKLPFVRNTISLVRSL